MSDAKSSVQPRAKCRLCNSPRQVKGGGDLCSIHYRRKLAYRGLPQGWVDAEPVRQHLHALKSSGMPMVRVSELVDMNPDSVADILHGRRSRVQANTAQKILGIEPYQGEPDDPKARILAVGTVRRLRAMIALGHSPATLGSRLGLTRAAIHRIVNDHQKLVRVSTAEAVERLFDELQVAPPPEGGQADRIRTLARKKHWPHPFDWDEDAIDDPDARPVRLEPVRANRAKWLDSYWELKEWGMSDERIADRLGLRYDSMITTLRRSAS